MAKLFSELVVKSAFSGNEDAVLDRLETLAGDGVAAKAEVVALVALTDSSGGTASDTIADVPGTYTEATLANQIASLTAKINAVIAALKA